MSEDNGLHDPGAMGLDVFTCIGLSRSGFKVKIAANITAALTAVHVAPGIILRAAPAHPATRETRSVFWNVYIVTFSQYEVDSRSKSPLMASL